MTRFDFLEFRLAGTAYLVYFRLFFVGETLEFFLAFGAEFFNFRALLFGELLGLLLEGLLRTLEFRIALRAEFFDFQTVAFLDFGYFVGNCEIGVVEHILEPADGLLPFRLDACDGFRAVGFGFAERVRHFVAEFFVTKTVFGLYALDFLAVTRLDFFYFPFFPCVEFGKFFLGEGSAGGSGGSARRFLVDFVAVRVEEHLFLDVHDFFHFFLFVDDAGFLAVFFYVRTKFVGVERSGIRFEIESAVGNEFVENSAGIFVFRPLAHQEIPALGGESVITAPAAARIVGVSVVRRNQPLFLQPFELVVKGRLLEFVLTFAPRLDFLENVVTVSVLTPQGTEYDCGHVAADKVAVDGRNIHNRTPAWF